VFERSAGIGTMWEWLPLEAETAGAITGSAMTRSLLPGATQVVYHPGAPVRSGH
jgi:hypothetical protein